MVSSAAATIFGGVRFTAQQAQFLQAGIRRGLGVRQLRTVFRESFNRGLPSPAFTAARALLTEGELAGVRLSRLRPGQRIQARAIPRVSVVRRSGRFLVTGKITARIAATGETIERFIRFASDELPGLDSFRREAGRILQLGVKQADSDMDLESIGELSVIEQVELAV